MTAINKSFKIQKANTEDYPYDLLLLADETVEAINKYLYDSAVYIVKNSAETIGVFCLFPIDEQTVEIKNIAVAEKWQGKGIGSFMMKNIEEIARQNSYRKIIVGTADCGIKQLHFYNKNGYTAYAVKENFFLENYTQPIYENGIMLKNMIMLKKEVKNKGSQFHIERATTEDYPQIMKVWESSVKATHHFLKAGDFEYYKQMGPTKYLPAASLYVLRLNRKITGFIGVSGNHLELLFIDADSRGKGYGKVLLNYAIEHLGIATLDVNEQNKQAFTFYKKMGFRIAGRSEKDAEGKDYPILHLELVK